MNSTPYWDMARKLKVPFCGGKCGIGTRSHDHGFIDPFDCIHFRERRFTRRGAKHFLMLVAQRERRIDEGWRNDDRLFGAYYLYRDSVRAQQLAGELGFRIPAHLFNLERLKARHLIAEAKRGINPRAVNPNVSAWLAR